MKIDDAKNIVKDSVSEIIDGLGLDTITNEIPLFGEKAILDSMKLVELCLLLEDKASELDFEFEWTTETAMSNSRSIFKTVDSLAQEFHKQFKEKK